MKFHYTLTFIFTLSFLGVHAQDKDKDDNNKKHHSIDAVVVTGQYNPQAVNKSIYQIEVITQEDIKNRGANTIADILNYNLNIMTVPNRRSGDSEISLFGLNSEYFKVMIDNIPVISDNGMGSNVDLTKINLDNVERIEIVKGSMGVDYGSNSLTGIINIITKKSNKNKWYISAHAQEETVGSEYDWKEKGRHIQSLNISHNITPNWYLAIGGNRNNFEGFFGESEGKRYPINDGKRGYEWLPKDQWNAYGIINFKSKNFHAFYKLQFLNELINFYNPIVRYAPLETGQSYTYSATDRDFNTDRWIHHLSLNTKLFSRVNYKGDFSYQKQDRKFRDYTYDIGKRNVFGDKNPYSSYAKNEIWYTRGTFSNFIINKPIDFQLGYEFNLMDGFRSSNSGAIGNISTGFKDNIKRRLDTYDVFGSAELKTNVGLSFRPGFRTSFNSQFDTQYSFSFATKYNISDNSDLRAEFASTNRTPNFDELYTYFVDTNHNIQGNENLTPEKGYSTAMHWNQNIPLENSKLKVNLSTLYISLKDKIELSLISASPLEYKYININKFYSWGLQGGTDWAYNNFNLSLGASLFGTSRRLEDNQVSAPDDYLYNFQLNSSASYTIKKLNTTISAYYKFTGKDPQYVYDSNSSSYYLGKQDSYNMLDASVRTSFLKNKLELTVGARNLFDVTNVNTTAIQAGAHSGDVSKINLSYGRSYFVKLGINLDF